MDVHHSKMAVKLRNGHLSTTVLLLVGLTLWRRNFLLNFSTPCIFTNVNITGTKKGSIMK
jgi:hypothetical protein